MYECEYDLEQALDKFNGDPEKWVSGDFAVEVPLFAVEDAIERLKRYEVIVSNLVVVSNFLWKENLRKYGERKIHAKETPEGVFDQDTYKRMCSFVNHIDTGVDSDAAFVEIALQMSRFVTGDPTGLTQYQDKESEMFERLENLGESDNG
jgi:myo-inositol-1-phosphate synthase